MKPRHACALAIVAALPPMFAFAQDHKGPPPPKHEEISVIEAIAIGNALRSLGDHPETVQGPNGPIATGKTVTVPYKFDGGVLMTMAIDIAAADQALKNYQAVAKTVFDRYAVKGKDGKAAVPPDKLADEQAELDKAAAAPSGQLFAKIKAADLCMEMKPKPPCSVTNSIPPAALSALLPIIER